MKSDSKCKIDEVQVGEIHADMFSPPGVLTCKYAYVESKTTRRMGSGNFNQWSDETLNKFKELIELMERDISYSVFEGYEPTTIDRDSDFPVDSIGGVTGL